MTVSRGAHVDEFVKRASKSKWGAAVLLFTEKMETSALYKSLALRYAGKLVLGEVRGRNKELAARFNVTSLPTVLAICGGDESLTVVYDGSFRNTQLTKWLNGFYGRKRCTEAIKLDGSADLSKLKVSQLKQILQAKGLTCKDCVEKADFVRQLQQVLPSTA